MIYVSDDVILHLLPPARKTITRIFILTDSHSFLNESVKMNISLIHEDLDLAASAEHDTKH